jgi:hypothetical protein
VWQSETHILSVQIVSKVVVEVAYDLQTFPYDRHLIPFELATRRDTAGRRWVQCAEIPVWAEPTVEWEPEDSTILFESFNERLSEFDRLPPLAVLQGVNRPFLAVRVRRKPAFVVWNIMLPIITIISVALATFVVPDTSTEMRFSAIITSSLTLATFRATMLKNSIPMNVNYLTGADWCARAPAARPRNARARSHTPSLTRHMNMVWAAVRVVAVLALTLPPLPARYIVLVFTFLGMMTVRCIYISYIHDAHSRENVVERTDNNIWEHIASLINFVTITHPKLWDWLLFLVWLIPHLVLIADVTCFDNALVNWLMDYGTPDIVQQEFLLMRRNKLFGEAFAGLSDFGGNASACFTDERKTQPPAKPNANHNHEVLQRPTPPKTHSQTNTPRSSASHHGARTPIGQHSGTTAVSGAQQHNRPVVV